MQPALLMLDGHSRADGFAVAAVLAILYLILIDAVINYFVFEFAGRRLPLALLSLPVVFVLGVWRGPASLFSAFRGAGFVLLVVSVILGAMGASEIDSEFLLQMPLALAAFVAGYLTAAHFHLAGRILPVFMLAVCSHILLAMTIYLGLLPRADTVHYVVDGMLVDRVFLYMDPNYTTYYLVLASSLLFVRNRLLLLAAMVGCLSVIAVLVIVATRSGVMVLAFQTAGALALRLVVGWRDRDAHKSVGGMIVFVTALVAMTWAMTLIAHAYLGQDIDILERRFLSPGNDDNVNHRLLAYEYMATIFGRSGTFVPIGQSTFLFETGNVLHAAIPGMFAMTGVLGVLAWLILIAGPLVRATMRLVRVRSVDDPLLPLTIALLGMFAVSLTLPTPFQNQLWLLAGLTSGVLSRAANVRRTAPARGRAGTRPPLPLRLQRYAIR